MRISDWSTDVCSSDLLNISTNRDRMSQERPDVVNVQSTDTTVTGRLGEWITLAGVNRQTQADNQGLSRSYSTQGRDDMILRVKVETLKIGRESCRERECQYVYISVGGGP